MNRSSGSLFNLPTGRPVHSSTGQLVFISVKRSIGQLVNPVNQSDDQTVNWSTSQAGRRCSRSQHNQDNVGTTKRKADPFVLLPPELPTCLPGITSSAQRPMSSVPADHLGRFPQLFVRRPGQASAASLVALDLKVLSYYSFCD